MSFAWKHRVRIAAPWVVLGLMSMLAIPAVAKKPPTIKTSKNAGLNKTIYVDSKGRTVYVLTPETKSNLLCKSTDCLSNWPIVTVKSAHAKPVAGSGVKGKLGVLKRGKKFQVTLAGKPLYRFAGDSAKGDAKGVGISSFGGTWHLAGAKSSTASPPTGNVY
jgi:predicted lipoprotein with Yx(FWY)xxD motif